MSTEYFTFEGTVKWPWLTKPNKFGKYAVDFYPKDDATRKAIKATGFRGAPKESEDGWFYTFRRDPNKGPVELTCDGVPFAGLVGNGSAVTITLEVYDYDNPEFGKGKGSRLHSVAVKKLVEYNPPAPQGVPANPVPY